MKPAMKLDLNAIEHEVSITSGNVSLAGTLGLPKEAQGIVLFAHGSGSSRHSPRNQFVARVLESGGIATLLFDLLTHEEERVDLQTTEHRFDIHLLTNRLIGATNWALNQAETRGLRAGYFGASTGAAAALAAAAQLPESVGAVVSRGGRPDLAGESLGAVRAPTLLIVGERDEQVIELNRQALAQLHCFRKELVIIPRATHLFEEPGTLEEVADVAAKWFAYYLAPAIESPDQPEPHSPRLQKKGPYAQ
jgi:putative phosphoribosyl transferase